MEVTVKSCKTCPFKEYDHDYENFSCNHPNNQKEAERYSGKLGLSELFRTCPLKKEPIAIKLYEQNRD